MINNIQGAVFDMDGVVLDSLGVWHTLSSDLIRSRGLVPKEGLDEIIFSTSLEQGFDYLLSHYPLNMTMEQLSQLYDDFVGGFYHHKVQLKPGVRDLLKYFYQNNIKMVVATSSYRSHIVPALQRNGIYDYFTQVVTSTELGTSKHEPEIYLKAAEILGTAPQNTIVFEDSLYALITAKNAGFITVGVRDDLGEPDQEGLKKNADYYLNSMNDFTNIFGEEQ